MKSFNATLVAVAALGTLWAIPAQADTIFEVEHARHNARAGPVGEYDGELLDRWGATSGSYYRSERRVRRYADDDRPYRGRRGRNHR